MNRAERRRQKRANKKNPRSSIEYLDEEEWCLINEDTIDEIVKSRPDFTKEDLFEMVDMFAEWEFIRTVWNLRDEVPNIQINPQKLPDHQKDENGNPLDGVLEELHQMWDLAMKESYDEVTGKESK